MNPPQKDSSELLQKHVGWLRALARELVSDPELAEDLTQDTLVIALQRPPRDDNAVRSWLSRVLRNRSAERYRQGKAREARELFRGPSGDAEATDEIASLVAYLFSDAAGYLTAQAISVNGGLA